MKTLLISLLLIPLSTFSQNKITTYYLSDSGSVVNPAYLSQLDSIFGQSKIIGLGESTHGTSEFTTIRTEMFKYLVVNHNYSIFFLEADYNACGRVNRFIQGAEDNAEEALKEVRLWPWLTQELLDFIGWMRMYNMQHDNILEFVGCDMQLIADDKVELPRCFSMNPKLKNLKSLLPSLDFNTNDSSLLLSKQKEWKAFTDTFSKAHSDEEPLLFKSLNQWFEEAVVNGYKGHFRDSCMGNNIVDYLDRRPEKKGIYLAHNEHVGKIPSQYAQNEPIFRRAGDYIDERLKDQYFAIAFEFNTGSFNALNYVNDEFVMEYFTFKKSKKHSLAHHVLGNEDEIKFVPSKSIPDNKKLKINSIGSTYGKSKSGYKIYRFRNFNKDHFDAYIVINKASPTSLLTFNPKENKD
jgi:erythromycin esterase